MPHGVSLGSWGRGSGGWRCQFLLVLQLPCVGQFWGDVGCISGGSRGNLEGMLGGFWVGLELIMGRCLAAGKRATHIA